MSGENTNPNEGSTATETKLPPKLVVPPEYEVTQRGQFIEVDASQSSSPTGKIDCFYFKQTGIWKSESERLALDALEGGKLGICKVQYPITKQKPEQDLQIEVKVVDTDKLERVTTVKFIDKIDYGQQPPQPLVVGVTPDSTTFLKRADELPFVVHLKVVASGKNPLSAEWFVHNEHVAYEFSQNNFEATLTLKGEGQISIGCTVTDADGQKKSSIQNYILQAVITPPADFDEFGTKMLHAVTGKKVDMLKGSDHRNGQRYNTDHKFKNYMMIGYFKTGQGQDIIEMKTDGPHHGGHTADVPTNTWIEPDIDLKDGQSRVSSEHPHPKNHKSGAFGIKYGNLENKWIGFSVVAYQDGEYRHVEQYCDKDPFDSNGKPKNNWVKGIDVVDKGQICNIDGDNKDGAKRAVPPANGEVLEAEIRMNNGTNHDTEMKWCRVYEIVPPV
jgi:hypothetical protein